MVLGPGGAQEEQEIVVSGPGGGQRTRRWAEG